MKNNELDNIDKQIITMLQENARISLKEIAEKVFLSSPAVSVRIDNLLYNGYIQGFHACVNPVKRLLILKYHLLIKKNFIHISENVKMLLNVIVLRGIIQCYLKCYFQVQMNWTSL